MTDWLQMLGLAADNVERARKTGIAEYLAGWEHQALRQAESRIEQLITERDTAIREMTHYAREAGEAKGRLEGSEMAGVVDGWREKCEALEAQLAVMREALTLARTEIGWWVREHSCCQGHEDTVVAKLDALISGDADVI